jgi:hypothetical protein
VTDDPDHFTEAKLMKLFSARARGKVNTIIDIGRGLGVLGKWLADAIRERNNPRRMNEILGEPLESERLRDAAGRTMVGDEAPSFGPRREDVP